MKSREDLLQTLQDILAEMFELNPRDITLDSHLKQDLDIDSIDAVDLMVKLRDVTGHRIQPDDFKNARTVRDVVETLHKMYSATAS